MHLSDMIGIVSIGSFWAFLILALCPKDTIQGRVPNVATKLSKFWDDDIGRIKFYTMHGAGKHKAYEQLALLSDKFGSRMSGTQALQDATDYVIGQLKLEGFDVHTENVKVPRWIRGNESAEAIIDGRKIPMKILGLGTSIGTSGLSASAVVVGSFDELEKLGNKVRGKIVVYNQPWTGYGGTAVYRVGGAAVASKLGAVATLIRSATPLSIYSPHTGMQSYGDSPPIPTACITVEDAAMLQRWQDRGANITINVYMESKTDGSVIQQNIVAEIKGSHYPEQTVIFGGHFDSWDVGTGSLDDGGGVMIAWQALRIMKALELPLKRTLRLVLFTAEEQGIIGGQEYYRRHKSEASNVSLIMESDVGAFKPYGIRFSGSAKASDMLKDILSPLADLNITQVIVGHGDSSDTGQWVEDGVPGIELLSYNDNYFYYHHSSGDTMSVMDADALDICSVLWATIVYSVGNLDALLPR